MEQKVKKWGNSLAIRIPIVAAKELGLTEDSRVVTSKIDNAWVVIPVEQKKETLNGMISKITSENIHQEIKTGKPVGKELW